MNDVDDDNDVGDDDDDEEEDEDREDVIAFDDIRRRRRIPFVVVVVVVVLPHSTEGARRNDTLYDACGAYAHLFLLLSNRLPLPASLAHRPTPPLTPSPAPRPTPPSPGVAAENREPVKSTKLKKS